MRRAFLILVLPVTGCGGLSDVPSLASRPAETTDVRGLAVANGARPAQVPADPLLIQRIAVLLSTVREGDENFIRAESASAALVAKGRSGSTGSEAWLAAQAALSASEAARQSSVEGLAAIDQLLVEHTVSGGAGLAEIQAARIEAERIVRHQTERLNQTNR